VGVKTFLSSWPVYRQLTGTDPLGRGAATKSPATGRTTARIATADSVTQSVCPYCAVGCGQKVYAKDGRVVQIEGDPDSPVSRGRLCPKGSASEQLVNSAGRITQVLHRRPYSTEWEPMDLDEAMERVAEKTLAARRTHWSDADENGVPLRRTTGFALLGGATLDNEENYLIKKLLAASGAVQVENQARI
jgi:formate dehydrogenase major subunit